MNSKFNCPSCSFPLEKDIFTRAKKFDGQYFQVWCHNVKCPSDVAQKDGGSAETEEAAYRNLCNAVDNETERLGHFTDETEEDRKEHIRMDTGDHLEDLRRSGGA